MWVNVQDVEWQKAKCEDWVEKNEKWYIKEKIKIKGGCALLNIYMERQRVILR